jgi:hypothetical protein
LHAGNAFAQWVRRPLGGNHATQVYNLLSNAGNQSRGAVSNDSAGSTRSRLVQHQISYLIFPLRFCPGCRD